MANDQIPGLEGGVTPPNNGAANQTVSPQASPNTVIENYKIATLDQHNYRIAIVILGILGALIICLYFALSHSKMDDAASQLLTIGATIVGALAGILVPQVTKSNNK